jgi:MinD-like ATPase involved in chromosome partitioning or flagellar assembly
VGDTVADDGQHGESGPAHEEGPDPAARTAAQAPRLSGTQPPFGSPAPSFAPVPPARSAPPAAADDPLDGPLQGAPGGYGAAGYGPDYYGPSGYGIEDYGPAGYGFEDYGPAGYGIEDYGPAAYPTGDQGSDGYGPAAYGLADYGPAGYGQAAQSEGQAQAERQAQGESKVQSRCGDAEPDVPPVSHGLHGYGGPDDYRPPDPYRPAEAYSPPAPAPGTSASDAIGEPQDVPAKTADQHGAALQPPPRTGAAVRPAAPASAAPPACTPKPGAPAPGGAFGPADEPAAPIGSRPRAATDAADHLTPELLLPGRRRAPAPGWRRLIFQATGGVLRVPLSAAELRRQEMISRARAPVAGGHHRVAVMSLKGGVGKTTTTVGLGSTLAALRGDRVVAVDANPDRGTLSDKVPLETAATIRDLLNEGAQIRRYADVRTFTSQAASRLEILASDRDPTVSVAFSEDDYRNVCAVLEHYYSICITDCGTGLMHSAMAGVLHLADQVVMVSTPSVDGARSASATLDWLEAHGYGDLVRDAVVVLCAVRPRSRSSVDLNRLEEYFAARCRAVARIPYDAHLEEGAEIELDLLGRGTADAYLALAAIVGDGLARPRGYAVHGPGAG